MGVDIAQRATTHPPDHPPTHRSIASSDARSAAGFDTSNSSGNSTITPAASTPSPADGRTTRPSGKGTKWAVRCCACAMRKAAVDSKRRGLAVSTGTATSDSTWSTGLCVS